MPILTSKKLRGRKTFDHSVYKDTSAKLWKAAEANPKKTPTNPDSERFAKLVDCLALHLSGIPIREAALSKGFTANDLYKFKSVWSRRDASIAPLLANLLDSGASKALVVFHKKVDDLDASEAANSAATLIKAGVALRQGEATNYQPPESVTLALLDRVTKVLEVAKQEPKELRGKTYDI